VAPRNTVGDIPLVEWHKDEEHIGYDIKGRKIKKQPRKDKVASFLEGADDPKNWYLKILFDLPHSNTSGNRLIAT
jgi:ribosome biogenesis protein ERB1